MDKGRLSWQFAGTTKFYKFNHSPKELLEKKHIQKIKYGSKTQSKFPGHVFYIHLFPNQSKQKKKYVFYDAMLDCINSFNLFGLFL